MSCLMSSPTLNTLEESVSPVLYTCCAQSVVTDGVLDKSEYALNILPMGPLASMLCTYRCSLTWPLLSEIGTLSIPVIPSV